MKITRVSADNRRRRFDVKTRHHLLHFPYAKAEPTPCAGDPVVELFVDPELAREGFVYRLASGAEGTILMDWVFDYNADPVYLADLTLYRVTTEAKKRFEESGLSVREVATALRTSPAQLYRLLDPTNYTKSFRQVVALLSVLGYEVDFQVLPTTKRDPDEARAELRRTLSTRYDEGLKALNDPDLADS
jgi:hypothetical protein